MRRLLKLLVSIAVTVLFSWWAFRDTDWSGQWASLKSANYLWVIPYFGILAGIHLSRTVRWGCLLSGIEKVRFRPLNEASAIGFMMLIILPFRLGEFARPFLIAQRSGIRRSAAMTTVVLERIVDGLVIATLLRVLLFFVPATQSRELTGVKVGSNLMFAIFGGGLAFLLFALWHQKSAVRFVRWALRFSPGLAEKVADVVDRFVGAMRHLPSARQIAGFFFFTFTYWALNGWGMSILARAFDCSGAAAGSGCLPMELGLMQGYVVLTVLIVGLMIPSAPGMMGTFQWATKLGLGLFLPAQVVNTSGLAFANVMWLTQSIQQIGLGLVMMSLGHLSFRELTGKLNDEEAELIAPTSSVGT